MDLSTVQSICRFFSKIDLQENFPSRQKCIHLQTEGGGGQDLRKTQKLPQKVSDGKRSLSIFMCIVVYVYN